MSVAEIIALVGLGLVGLGLLATWRRNGRNEAEYLGGLKVEISNIKAKLDDKDTGLSAIKNGVNEQKVHCAEITSGFAERIKTLEKRGK